MRWPLIAFGGFGTNLFLFRIQLSTTFHFAIRFRGVGGKETKKSKIAVQFRNKITERNLALIVRRISGS